MRKYHKKLILEMMDSLSEANKEMKKCLKKSDVDNLTNLLADSQDVIENIDNFFSSYDNIPEEVINGLTAYYQLLFKMHSSPNSDVLEEMRASVYTLTHSIKNKVIANKIEVAFLPYSASMFDSLESIWLAAKEDPDCDAYLVPIPYYSRDNKGNLDKMHYDGDYYRDKYNITYWGDYDIKARHPDIIYIHNPYDDCNYVTSVHPDYYSRVLKEHTDLLAYIPYFITRNNLDMNFSTPPATVHADKVFVQSERDREIYIENHKEHYKIDPKISKERFIAIGSPKVDKVLNSKKEDYTLPQKWDKLIKNSDGSSKKIILYITSLSPLLSGGIEYIKKLQSVFEYFSKRDDVVLWWRPHPLTNDTYSSMRPQLQEIYNKITKFYIDANIGIYDDTHDLHRAIAYSDAYYGDYSSVDGLYGFTDKLIVYQTIKIQNYYDTLEDDFEKMFKRLIDLYENNTEQDINRYLIWEVTGYRVSLLISHLKENTKSKDFRRVISGRKTLNTKMSLQNDGRTGQLIYRHCKEGVLK